MLVRFVASNFLSLKEEVEFNMLTGDFEAHKHHVYQAGEVEVLKAAAIYGANGAGKSNLVKAINYLQRLVKAGGIFEPIGSKKFKLDPNLRQAPISFEIEFHTNESLYSYGVAIGYNEVVEEWLYKNDIMIFERTPGESGKVTLKLADEYQKTEKQKLLIELVQDNLLEGHELLLSKNKNLKVANELDVARGWILDQIKIMYPQTKYEGLVNDIVRVEGVKRFVNDALGTFDAGAISIGIAETKLNDFTDISIDEKRDIIQNIDKDKTQYFHDMTKDGPIMVGYEDGDYLVKKLTLQHAGADDEPVDFMLSEESNGTQRLLDYLPAISAITDLPITFIIDEIDQSVHVNLLKTLLQKVMDDENTKGQLIFTTHESNLLDLDIFRQDEIWFAEKERETGATHFYSLSEFKPDYGSDIEKGYLNGRFGAIPFLGNLETLNWHPHAEKE